MVKKAELLSPAGSFEGLIGAINAGADAIYLGGTRFSARAYSANFDDESLIRALNLAHLFKRRIYLALNTLIKEKEFSGLYDYLGPLYEVGLDAVIIQDFGVLKWLNENFPGLPVHASTQMNITHAYGAEFLRKAGVTRIIPARELCLAELADIRKNVDIELETFIHGAMCYSYSGRCLFSSMLGGRSGNRGRCAQPCRLPYQYREGSSRNCLGSGGGQGKSISKGMDPCHILSLKDMCTLEILPDLIKAGIHAFKIEGRMKKPEYAAGVTAVYRKYIDLYYAEKTSAGPFVSDGIGHKGGNHGKSYAVAPADRKMLESLYIRSELSLGYYLGKNKTRMITLEKPSYNSSDEDLLKNIRAFYLEKKLTIAVNGKIKLHPFEKAELEITCEDAMRKDAMREDAMCEDVVCENEMCKNVTVTATGEIVQAAKSQPLSAEMVNKQIRKTGETDFCFDRLIIDSADPVFVSVKELNTLRRLAISLLEKELLKPYRRKMPESAGKYEAESAGKCEAESAGKCEAESVGKCGTELQETQDAAALRKLHIKIATIEQWESITDDAIMGNSMTCNIITSDAVKDNAIKDNAIANKLSLSISRIYADIDLWKSIISEKTPTLATECYAVLPPVIQSVDAAVFAVYQEIVNHPSCAGVLIGNAEGYEWLNRIGCQKPIVLDYTLYIWNLEAYRFWNGRGAVMFYLPPELNSHELKEILAGTEQAGLSVYGRVPMMYSANCVRRNAGACVKASGFSAIVDRYKKRFPVYHNCRQCYNIIYNSVPLSLHEMIKSGRFNEISSYRLDFTTESGPEAKRTIMYFADLLKGRESERPYQDYTTGHFKRGVQ